MDCINYNSADTTIHHSQQAVSPVTRKKSSLKERQHPVSSCFTLTMALLPSNLGNNSNSDHQWSETNLTSLLYRCTSEPLQKHQKPKQSSSPNQDYSNYQQPPPELSASSLPLTTKPPQESEFTKRKREDEKYDNAPDTSDYSTGRRNTHLHETFQITRQLHFLLPSRRFRHRIPIRASVSNNGSPTRIPDWPRIRNAQKISDLLRNPTQPSVVGMQNLGNSRIPIK